MARALIVDDEADVRDTVAAVLTAEGLETIEAEDGEAALVLIERAPPDVVVLDLGIPKLAGMEVLRRARGVAPDLPIIMLTGVGDVRTAVEAMRLGATDYLTKPFLPLDLRLRVRRALERRALLDEIDTLKSEITHGHSLAALMGTSRPIQDLIHRVQQVAGSDFTVLIQGETGTGKELVARAIHHQSRRRDKPFIAIDCGAIPDTLIESELFGYEKGAFTGAERRKEGHFQLADGGTLFLDEVANLPPPVQSKLLRALQERTVWPLGARAAVGVDVRIIAACNVALEAETRTGPFRPDLYYRLSEFPITLPPLRERRDDVAPLAARFLEEASVELKRPARGLAPDAVRALLAHGWPGNVRELRNVVRRAVLVSRGVGTGPRARRQRRRVGRHDAEGGPRPGRGRGRAACDPHRAGRRPRQQERGGPTAQDRLQDAAREDEAVRHFRSAKLAFVRGSGARTRGPGPRARELGCRRWDAPAGFAGFPPGCVTPRFGIRRALKSPDARTGSPTPGVGRDDDVPGFVAETAALRWSQSLNVADSVARRALLRGISVIVPWVLSDALFHYAGTAADRSARAGDRALLVVPVMARGRALGVLALADRRGRVFGDGDLAVAERLARLARRAFDLGEPADRHSTIVRDGLVELGGQSAALYALTADGERLVMVAGCHG